MASNASAGDDPGNDTDVSPKEEPAPTPLISVADVPLSVHPVVRLSDDQRYLIEERASQISDSWSGTRENHITGKYGEAAFAEFVGLEDQLDLEVYPDGGDGGYDMVFDGAEVDVKTTTRCHAEDPILRVNIASHRRADYYVLVSRIGPGDFRLIGYTPRWFVVNAPVREKDGSRYHVVYQDYLYPFVVTGVAR